MYTNNENKRSCNKGCKCFFDFGLALLVYFLHSKKEEKVRKKISVCMLIFCGIIACGEFFFCNSLIHDLQKLTNSHENMQLHTILMQGYLLHF